MLRRDDQGSTPSWVEGFLEAIPLATSLWRHVGEDFLLVHVNQLGAGLTEGPSSEPGRSILELYGHDSCVVADLQRYMETQAHVHGNGHVTLRTPGGERHLTTTYGFIAPDLVVVCARDLTGEFEAVGVAEEASRRFRAAFQNAPIGMALVSLSPQSPGQLLAVNTALTETFATSKQALINTLPFAWSHPDDAGIGTEELEALLRGEHSSFSVTKRWLREDGTLLWGTLQCSVVPGTDPAYGVMQLLDITEQHASTAKVAASEAKFRRMAELSRSTIFSYALGATPGLDYVSPAVEEMSGYLPEEFYADGTLLSRLLHPESARFLTDTRELLDGWTTVRWRHRDGSDVWTEQHLGRVLDDAGRTIAVQGEIRDITRRRRADLELRQQAAIVEAATDAIVTVDLESRVVSWNPGAEELLGYTAEEMIGTDLRRLTPPGLAEERIALAGRITAGDAVVVESQSLHKDGSRIDISAAGYPLRDETGAVEGMSVIARDIRAAKRRERELGQLAAVVDSSGEAIFAVSLQGVILTWNRGAQVTFGFPASEAIGADVQTLASHDDTGEMEAALRTAELGRTIQVEVRSRHRDGHAIDVAMCCSPMETAAGVASISVVGRDISEQVADARERVRLQAELSQTQRLETAGQLAGGMAHDFNNLLAVVNLYGEFALDALGADHPAREEVEHMCAATRRAAELTGQLLTFSRRHVARTERLDAGEMLRELQHVLGRLVGPAVDLCLDATPAALPIMADRSQFEQVVINLVGNARDAMPHGGSLTITAAVAPDDGHNGPEVVLTVDDTGAGMTDEVRGHIFEPFFTTKPRGEGTGLGLATVYGIVGAAGGRIEVESRPGAGTRFEIGCPLAPEGAGEPQAPDAHPGAAPAPAPAPSAGGTVLLVEDDRALGRVTERVLRSRGYVVHHHTSPEDCIGLLEDDTVRVDAVLTDVVMPGASGPELASQIARLRPGLPVIFMSGFAGATEQIPPDAIFLAKPFSGDELDTAVRRALHDA